MSGVLKKACWLLPVLFVVSPVLAQQGGGIQSAANIESHISFMSVFRGLLGIVSLLAIAWLFSKDRKAISWKVVGIGLAMQLVLAVGILYVPAVQAIFEFFGKIFIRILAGWKYFLVGGSDGYHQSGIYLCFSGVAYDYILFGSDLLIVLSGHYSESGLCYGLGDD